MSTHDVLVRGAGVAGLCTALALSRQGLGVALLGSLAEPAQADVRAYALNAASVQLLRTLKVWDALPADARTPVHEMHVEGDAPGAAIDFSAWQQSLAELAWIVDAAELERALRAAVKFAPHVTPVAAAVPAALQVLAEGKASATRETLGVRMQAHAYGQTAVAARLHSDRAHGGLARQWFRCPDVLALLPLDRPSLGHGLALVWSLPDEGAATRMALSDADFTVLLNDATGGAAGTLTLAGPRASWPLRLAQADRLYGPGWVLVGDAAHVVHPLAGQGLNLGLADVAVLAEVLAARESWRPLGDEKLLSRYARQRLGPVQAMARVTDGLLHLFASEQPLLKELRNRGLSLANRLPPLKRLLTGQALGG
ncbi:MAG: 2-octaprenyl-3-methyl-6-methoxy-1,4-benzoquinol hydroxylase [Leptothrix sp. (in: Bacteria)]|nr:2-octaprenyl-3-methyl-6-methoxy-1,4-benzoquinol hydroxylase [Leptothrix sp. (in: b-proteobacteria)]